ncbi:MAG: xanthine dehydrogenase family protein molybdopterin-binding subunit [Pseudolabrys sp.]|nr:xanthine dehydrogenase family protein molybdopterin-binding subunit [Pseudolabrys sp.]
MTVHPVTLSRRQMMAGGGALVVSFSLARRGWGQDAPKPPVLPGDLKKTSLLDSWIRIDADGTITVFTGKSELGQGVKTALRQVAAEELSVPFAAINLVTSDTDRTPDEGFTSGSQSMSDSGTAILHAAAQVRELLVGLAATKLNADAATLTVQDGKIRSADGQSIGYGELVAGDVLHVQAQPQSKLKDPKAYSVVGRPVARVDIPAKVAGGVAYIQDMRMPGMVHARRVMPPSPKASIEQVDTSKVLALPGVLKVHRNGNFLAVIAEREYQAIVAMNALAAATTWKEAETLPERVKIYDVLRSLPAKSDVILDRAATVPDGGKVLSATFKRPYQMHGSIGPSCAVALFKEDALTVWSHGQGMFPLQASVSELLGMPKEKVRCIHVEGSGCYGHNGADDAGADAALLAVALPNRPVRVQWMRDQEHTWEPYGPAMSSDIRATIDVAGNVVDFRYDVWTNAHSTRPESAGNTLAGWLVARPFEQPEPKPIPQPAGGGDRNAIPLYKFPSTRVTHHFIPEMPVRVSALRALGAYMNVFSIESFMDELAASAKADPVEFRLKYLEDQRAKDIITTVADRFGWKDWRKRGPGHGRGFAFAKYKNLAAYVAVALDLDVDLETGIIQLGRAVAADDSGQVVNPDGIKNQVEGAIVQSASWTLQEEVAFDRTRITSRDWATYPILRFTQLFRSVDVHLIDRPGQPYLGTGEGGQGPAAAAIANAVADATGRRIRELPLTPERVKAALSA